MTLEEAKQMKEEVLRASAIFNHKLKEAHAAGLNCELEIREHTRQQIGMFSECYSTVDVRCSIDPTKID